MVDEKCAQFVARQNVNIRIILIAFDEAAKKSHRRYNHLHCAHFFFHSKNKIILTIIFRTYYIKHHIYLIIFYSRQNLLCCLVKIHFNFAQWPFGFQWMCATFELNNRINEWFKRKKMMRAHDTSWSLS